MPVGRARKERRNVEAGGVSVLVVSRDRAFPLELPTDLPVALGSGPHADVRLEDERVEARHVSLRATGEGVEVADLTGTGGTRLNDVQVSGATVARAGDQIAIGDVLLIVQRGPAPARRGLDPLLGFGELEDRQRHEVRRSRRQRRPLGLLLLRFPGSSAGQMWNELGADLSPAAPWGAWGELAPDVLALLCPETGGNGFAEVKDRVTGAVGAHGVRFQLGHAELPEDGVEPESLWESALARLGGGAPTSEEPLFLDAVMVRLLSVMERLARSRQPVLIEGEPGSGKETLARALVARGARGAAPVVVRGLSASDQDPELELFGDGRGGRPGALATRGGTVLLDNVEALSLPSQERLAQALERGTAARLIALRTRRSDEPDLPLAPALEAALSRIRLWVPSLADRRGEIQPLAEAFVARACRVFGKPRLGLSSEARAALVAHAWPGNVRELRMALERAVLAAAGGEVRAGDLPPRILAGSGVGRGTSNGRTDLRSTLRAAEREVLLDALTNTRWNVTQAAKRLGLPRRTVVYRMSRLGLRRPRG